VDLPRRRWGPGSGGNIVTGVVLAELNGKLSWYAARASGLVAWAIVTLSILWGLALSTRLIRRKGIPAWLLDLHKFLGTLSIVFVAVHLFALWADNFVYFGARELFVPFASPWRPGAIAWGIAATYLLVAIQLTSWMMKRLPRKLWHSVHLLSFPMFVFSTVHGFTSGADNMNLAVQWVALTGGLAVFLLISFRVLAPRRSRRAASAPRPARVRDPEPSERALRSRGAQTTPAPDAVAPDAVASR
jgi:predicted ferric reductase